MPLRALGSYASHSWAHNADPECYLEDFSHVSPRGFPSPRRACERVRVGLGIVWTVSRESEELPHESEELARSMEMTERGRGEQFNFNKNVEQRRPIFLCL